MIVLMCGVCRPNQCYDNYIWCMYTAQSAWEAVERGGRRASTLCSAWQQHGRFEGVRGASPLMYGFDNYEHVSNIIIVLKEARRRGWNEVKRGGVCCTAARRATPLCRCD